MWRKVALAFFRVVVIMLLAGLLGATLIRIAPGFASDERQLNSNLSAQSMQAIRQTRIADANILQYYARLAILSQLSNSRLVTGITEGLSGTFISTPAAVLALVFILLRFPPQFAPALLVFPKIYRYCHNLLRQGYDLPHVLTARAKGAGSLRVLVWHVLPTILPQVLALFGVSVSLALTALLPIEVICDVSGIGQLAWQAAEGRDLTLLVGLTLAVTLIAVSANTFSDLARQALTRRSA
jgi:ABC-type dipeptide/oligopeptide/nickel transport system permease component